MWGGPDVREAKVDRRHLYRVIRRGEWWSVLPPDGEEVEGFASMTVAQDAAEELARDAGHLA